MSDLSRLSPEQREVVDSWGEGLAVMAGAGSGKTTTLVVKCAELLRKDPEARFVAVSFTERSASDLRVKLSEALPGAGLSGQWAMTIHGLCGTIIREHPREAGMEGDEKILTEPESETLWQKAQEALWFDSLPPAVQLSLEYLLERETRDSLAALLRRVKSLRYFGALDSLEGSEDESSRWVHLVASFVLERYERLKRRQGAMDFGDLERGADLALESASVRAAYHTRFSLVLVDEFQDTNPLQARILWRFAKPDVSNLCVVGDPKQSIYRFRDADVSVFEDCCSRLPKKISLTWNFRSRPGIIEFANEVCEQAFPTSGMKYEALVPQREAAEPDAHPVMKLSVRSPMDLANWIRSERARGVPLEEMALLLRKIRGNEHWLKALAGAGIPIAVGSGGLFWEDPRVRELTAFLKWWENPGNQLSGATFLRAPWVGISDQLLDEWIRIDPTWQKPFFASAFPLAKRLKDLRGRVLRPGEVLIALLITEEIENELGVSLIGLWHRAEELSSRGLDFSAVVSELSNSIRSQRREREVPPARNQGQLVVLTLHGSKGLEFPHVILLDFPERPTRSAAAPLLFWDREKGAFLGRRDSKGARLKKDPLEQSWRQTELERSIAESKRLFYVALTRARERLILVWPETAESALGVSPQMEVPAVYEKDFWRGWIEASGASLPEVRGSEIKAPSREAGGPSNVAETRPRRRKPSPVLHRPRHSVTEWNTLARCARAYEWTYVRPVLLAEGAEGVGLFAHEKIVTSLEQEITQRELGSQVHSFLERGDYGGLRNLETQVGAGRFLAEPVVSWATSSPWMKPPREGREVWTELAFEVPMGEEILVGSMDRLVAEQTEQGTHYTVIDFKVTEKPKSVEALLDAYQTQMELYTLALAVLDPQAIGRTEALIINISAQTIQSLPLPLSTEDGATRATRLAQHAAGIIRGEAGPPQPGLLCRVCEFRRVCPEGAAF